MNKKSVWIGNDHGGYRLKLMLKQYMENEGYEVVDVGSDSEDIVRYPYYAGAVAGAVARGEAWRGLLICSTGIGMSIIANKYKGVRAALCTSVQMGELTRAHNNSNVLCLGGKITSPEIAKDILHIWLNTEYIGGRHEISLNLIREAETAMISGLPYTFSHVE